MLQTKKKKVGKYVVLLTEKLGEGSFSKVFRGVDQSTSEHVAIKVASKQQIEQDDYTKNAFYSQIQIMKHLKSPNIIRFLDIHETKNNYYVIQELADGGTLRTLMRQNGKFPENQALNYTIQLLNGFGELVKNGIIHRDVKPQNILVKDDLLKIADFGFAKQSDNNSFMNTIVGTPLYMSPQLLMEKQYTYKCDIWALGIIVYELLVGVPPWQLKSKDMLENIKITQYVQFPEELKISPKTKDLVRGCLVYDEQDRYDWEQIYLHPIFGAKFKQNFVAGKQNSIKLAFVSSGLRMTIHSQNLDVARLIERLPYLLGEEDFYSLIKLMDGSLGDAQIRLLYQNCLSKYKSTSGVKREDLKQYLKQIGVRMSALDLSEIKRQSLKVVENGNDSRGFILVARLRRMLDQKQVDIYELYRKEDKSKKNAMGLRQFSQMVLKIDDRLKQEEIKALFVEFDLNGDGVISFDEYYRTLCKIAGVASVKEEKQSKIFKKAH